jgi:hypothetical protein
VLKQEQHQHQQAQYNQQQQQLHSQVILPSPTTNTAAHQQHQVPNGSQRKNLVSQKKIIPRHHYYHQYYQSKEIRQNIIFFNITIHSIKKTLHQLVFSFILFKKGVIFFLIFIVRIQYSISPVADFDHFLLYAKDQYKISLSFQRHLQNIKMYYCWHMLFRPRGI